MLSSAGQHVNTILRVCISSCELRFGFLQISSFYMFQRIFMRQISAIQSQIILSCRFTVMLISPRETIIEFYDFCIFYIIGYCCHHKFHILAGTI